MSELMQPDMMRLGGFCKRRKKLIAGQHNRVLWNENSGQRALTWMGHGFVFGIKRARINQDFWKCPILPIRTTKDQHDGARSNEQANHVIDFCFDARDPVFPKKNYNVPLEARLLCISEAPVIHNMLS